jgi:hypothetical protein
MNNVIEAVVVSSKKNPGLYRFTTKFYKIFTEKLIQILLKLFHETEREGKLSN